jgi:hypothetical protein
LAVKGFNPARCSGGVWDEEGVNVHWPTIGGSMTIPPHHGVGDAGHTTDHNSIADVLTSYATSLGTLTTAVTGVFYLAGNNVTTISDGTSYGWRINLPAGSRDTAPNQLAFYIGGKAVGGFNGYGEITATPALPSRTAVVVTGYDGTQSGDLQQWKTSAGTTVASVKPDGTIFAKNITAGTWTNIPLASGVVRWTSGGHRPQYRLRDDRIELRGVLQKSSGDFTVSPAVVATMPVGTIPGAPQYGLCASSFSGPTGWVRLEVRSDGTIAFYFAASTYNPGWVALDNFSYVLGAAS